MNVQQDMNCDMNGNLVTPHRHKDRFPHSGIVNIAMSNIHVLIINSFMSIGIWPTFLFCIIYRGETSLVCPVPCSCFTENGNISARIICDFVSGDERNNISPLILPRNTSAVHFQRVNRPDFFNLTKFEHSSWDNVQILTVEGWPGLSHISDNSLHGLTGLKVLRIHYNLGSLESGVFLDSPNLEVLDLSDNPHLRIEYISRSLRYGLPKLKMLDITRLQSFLTEPFVLGREFTESIINKPLKVLNISQTKLVSLDNNFTYSSLQVLNASRTSLIWIPRHPKAGMFPSVTEIDLSYVSMSQPVSFSNFLNFNLTFVLKICMDIFRSVRRIHAHHMSLGFPLRIIDVVFDVPCESYPAEELDISNSDIQWLNLRSNVKLLNLKVFIASRNLMEYISPKLLRSFLSLLELRLDHNRLIIMSSTPDFENILASSEALEILDLSYNGLKTLPMSFFVGAPKLKEINLQGNIIVHFGVDVGVLYNLRLLDLSDNGLLSIDVNVMEDLKAINLRRQETAKSKSLSEIRFPGSNSYELHRNYTADVRFYEKKSTFVVNLQGNNFDCSCEHILFLTWIEESNINFEGKYNYKCRKGFYIEKLDEENMYDLNNYCNFKRLLPFIILGSIFGMLLIFSIVITGVCLHRRSKFHTRRKEYVNDYNRYHCHDEISKRYPVFLSFCGRDEDVAKDYFYPMFANGLAKYFGKDDVVCLGEKDARPGRFIVSEIERCVSLCDVVILLVTSDFLKSKWCKYELKQAELQEKPLILLVEDEVLKQKMPPLLRKVLNTRTRATWKRRNNEITINPGWNVIIRQILDIAVTAKRDNILPELADDYV